MRVIFVHRIMLPLFVRRWNNKNAKMLIYFHFLMGGPGSGGRSPTKWSDTINVRKDSAVSTAAAA